MPRHPPNALIALDPKLLKRHAQRQVPALFAHRFGHSALSALPTADMCDDHEHRRLRRRRQQVPVASRKTPPTASHTFLSTMSKIETNLRSLSGNARAIDRQLAIPSNSPNSVALRSPIVGGADRTRTGDPLLAKQVLSQLSYSPIQILGIRCQVSDHPMPDSWRLASENWWAREDLNFRPHAYQARALTN